MSSDINQAFCRTLLRVVMDDIKTITTAKERKTAWVYKFGRDHWEFHGPDGFYWHGSADNAYDARANGWQAWRSHVESEHVDLVARLAAQKHREQLAVRS